jgi:Zn-dependent oligopeptidase
VHAGSRCVAPYGVEHLLVPTPGYRALRRRIDPGFRTHRLRHGQREAAFSHLNGYSAGYYPYGWSRVIAADLFSRFRAAGLRDTATAHDYRALVLGRGGSKPAAELIEDFLGRPVSADALKEKLAQGA